MFFETPPGAGLCNAGQVQGLWTLLGAFDGRSPAIVTFAGRRVAGRLELVRFRPSAGPASWPQLGKERNNVKGIHPALILVLMLSMLFAWALAPMAAAQDETPGDMPADLWRVITTRDGFNVYEGRTPPAFDLDADAETDDGPVPAETATTGSPHMPADLWRIITTRDGFNVYEQP